MATADRDYDRDRLGKVDPDAPDANRDPLSGAPGSHPVGVGVGAAGAGAAGAAIGAVGGPVGAAVGAVVGAVAGGLAGKGAAEAINPTAEEAYWRDNYKTRPYYTEGTTYEEYGPAYRYGWESRQKYGERKWDDVEGDLRSGWEKTKAKTEYGWDRAKYAVRDAWDRVTPHNTRRDADRTAAVDNPDLTVRSSDFNPGGINTANPSTGEVINDPDICVNRDPATRDVSKDYRANP